MPPRGRSSTPSGTVRSRGKSKGSDAPVLSAKSSLPDPAEDSSGPRKAMSGDAVAKDESKGKKIGIRVFYGALMVIGFLCVLFSGHVYVCLLVCALEFLLFKELVKVRYNKYIDVIESQIPLFRTTQWVWFFVAVFHTYGEFAINLAKKNTEVYGLEAVDAFKRGVSIISFGMYALTFVMTVVTLQRDHLKFQLNQLTWTICVLLVTLGQLKWIMHNVFNGLFWFTYPALLVVINDIMAYVSGMTCGRRFIKREFLALSPNKTWEGFIGGGIFTIIFGWYLAKAMSNYTWMTCPVSFPELFPGTLECEPQHIFQVAHNVIPPQVLEFLPANFARQIPSVVEFCIKASCGVGDETCDARSVYPCPEADSLLGLGLYDRPPLFPHRHDHFELSFDVKPVQMHAITLAIFASVVAPFGGFFASGIKRAYGIKDFDSVIPGHGGIMDRMDCQLLMALCSWVHYNAFVKMATVSVTKLMLMYKAMPPAHQDELLKQIVKWREANP